MKTNPYRKVRKRKESITCRREKEKNTFDFIQMVTPYKRFWHLAKRLRFFSFFYSWENNHTVHTNREASKQTSQQYGEQREETRSTQWQGKGQRRD